MSDLETITDKAYRVGLSEALNVITRLDKPTAVKILEAWIADKKTINEIVIV